MREQIRYDSWFRGEVKVSHVYSQIKNDGINLFLMQNWSVSVGQKSTAFQWAEHAFLLGSVFGQ